jgi:hypothetical protein
MYNSYPSQSTSAAKWIFIFFFNVARQRFDKKRLTERLQDLAQQREASLLAARMKAITDPSQMSKEEYIKRPLA